METEQNDVTDELDDHERYMKNVRFARSIMLNYNGEDATVPIYGLYLKRAEPDSTLWDIFVPEEDDKFTYIDSIDIDKFVSARGVVAKIIDYYPDHETAEQSDEEEMTEIDPTPAFH